MKIALCISGAIRSFESCYPSIYENIIKPLNCDIFCHVWTYGNDITIHEKNDQYVSKFKLQNDECNIFYLLQKLKPKLYVCEQYSEIWEQYIIEHCNGFDILHDMSDHDKNYAISAMSMYYKILKANELKCQYELKHDFIYDIVIRCRTDFYWNKILDVNLFTSLNKSQIILIKDQYCTNAKWKGNDKFFAAKSATMNKICNIYNMIYAYYIQKCIIEGQNLHKHHIEKLNLNIIYYGNQYTYRKVIGSKRINQNKNTENILVNKCNSFVGFHLCKLLLNKGYSVTGIDSKDYYIDPVNKCNKELLDSYDNFTFTNIIPKNILSYKMLFSITNISIFKHVKHNNKYYIYDCQNYKKLEKMYINFTKTKSYTNKFFLLGCFGTNCNKYNIVAKTILNKSHLSNTINVNNALDYILNNLNNLHEDTILTGNTKNMNTINHKLVTHRNIKIIEECDLNINSI